jgi:hypothetical protein
MVPVGNTPGAVAMLASSGSCHDVILPEQMPQIWISLNRSPSFCCVVLFL